MSKNIYKILLAIVAVMITMPVLAQSTEIAGKVVDATTGEGIPGATLVVKGTTNGTITNLDGEYKMEVTPDAVLNVSFLGYVTQEVAVGSRSTIDVSLQEDITELSEVVVIGYGTQKKKVVTGAIESISPAEITQTPIVRADQALQGRTPGVQVTNQSGQPGERPSVKIRGIGTDFNSEPLYLVDGIAVNNIDNVNPGDIQSIEVLKDAASSAIYGARAANGVILITTKTGGDKFTVTYSGYYGIQNAAKKVDVLNAEKYLQVMSDAGAAFDPNEIPANDTDWQDELFTKNAPIVNHEISVSGGNEKTKLLSSASYFSQDGIIGGDKSNFERFTARINSKTQVNRAFGWGNTMSFARVNSRGVSSNGSFNGEYSSALNLDPLTGVYETDADKLSQSPYSTEPVLVDDEGRVYAISENVLGEVVNPLGLLETRTQTFRKDQFFGSLFAELEPISGLKLKGTMGLDMSHFGNKSYQPLYYLSNTTNNIDLTSISKNAQSEQIFQSEVTANYGKRIGEHNFNVLAGASTHVTNYEGLWAGGDNVDVSNPALRYITLSTDSTRTASDASVETKRASVFGRVLYDYKDRISLSATYRRDGSSNFGSNNRFGEFWSVGGSWVINEEPFFPKTDAISFLKLRASWGQNGNDNIPSFSYESTVDFGLAYNFANGTARGALPEFVSNADIKWESSEQLNFGLESGFFDNRLTANFDYYKKVTKDLLQLETGLSSLGLPLSYSNAGEMTNEGFEFSIEWRNKGGEFNYSIGINGGYNNNKMTKIVSESGIIVGSTLGLVGEVTRSVEGYPVTSFYGYKTDGIFQDQTEVFSHIGDNGQPIQPDAEPGDIRYVDVNGDGVISGDDRTVIGTPIPKWTMGSTLSFSYKGFDLNALIIGQFGNELLNGITRTDQSTVNRQSYLLDQWTDQNPSNDVPRFTIADPNNNYKVVNDMVNIEDGSFVRIKNIKLAYNLPRDVLKRMGCTAWQWYVSADNLITFTKYRGSDPEIGSPIDGESHVPSIRDMGIDRGIYPQARTFRLGTIITF